MRRHLAVLIVAASVFVGSGPRASGQFVDQGNSPAENLRQRGARRPGLMVQAGIARHGQGPEISAQAPPDLNYRVTLLSDFFNNFLSQLQTVISLLPAILSAGPQVPGVGGPAQGGRGINDLVMTEIAHNGNVVFVELLSRAALRISLAGWHFADGNGVSPALPQIVLERNESVVVQLGGETQDPLADIILGFRVQSLSAGELALYDFSQISGGLLPVEDPNLIMDYVQWNSDTQGLDRNPPLESVAASSNLWTSVDAIRSSLANTSFRLNSDAEARTSTASRDFTFVSFGENTLGTPESQLASGG